jgi:hypothetical protein
VIALNNKICPWVSNLPGSVAEVVVVDAVFDRVVLLGVSNVVSVGSSIGTIFKSFGVANIVG